MVRTAPNAPSVLEILEPRIAPAVILIGGDAPDSIIKYSDAPFIQASLSSDPSVARLFDGSNDHYYLSLAPRDVVKFYNDTAGYQNFISLAGGRVFAFFFDANGDTEVQKNELSGFAVAQGTNLTVFGSVNGDIVGNLDARTQQLSPVDPGLAQDLLGLAITRLNIEGDVNGRIITGGNLSNVAVKTVDQITTASDGTYTFNWSGGAPGVVGQATLNAFVPDNARPGGNITGVNVANLAAIIAGGGGAGGLGGSISGVTVVSDPDGFLIRAGDGGDGVRGGKGGDVRNVLVNTVVDPLQQADLIAIEAGRGGDAVAGGTGGAGGSLAGLTIGYNTVVIGRTSALVEAPLGDRVELRAGQGGDGGIGGAGGSINTVRVALDVSVPGQVEFRAEAGDGGDGLRRDGAGGGIINITARNFSLNHDEIFLRAGQGGSSGVGGSGLGGSIGRATLFANTVTLFAGDGSTGVAAGGRGGSISNIVLDVLPTGDAVNRLNFKAGDGGDSLARAAGGAGGAISTVTGRSVDLLDAGPSGPSLIAAGGGGDSAQGRGGAGGGIVSVRITETVFLLAPGSLEIAGGKGGDGGAGGGVGGAANNIIFQGFATSTRIAAGHGGDAIIRGVGGVGGAVNSVAVQVFGGAPAGVGTIAAGNGGDGAGAGGRGAAGGRIASATLIYDGTAEVLGGQGGSDGGGAVVGAGGAVSRAVVQALAGDARVEAGSAGNATPTAVTGAAGGAISFANLVARDNVTVAGGNGSSGGAGGAVSNVSWFGIRIPGGQPDPGAAPGGAIVVAGGQGSVGPRTAGAGGAVLNVSGNSSADPTEVTRIVAGDGNGGVAGLRAAAGGSVSRVTLFGGGAGVIEILAGQGGSIDVTAPSGVGGVGGSVTGVSAAAGLSVKTIAAGDGGDANLARGRGGLGGSVSAVNVEGDIGIRTGQDFGIDTMGGVFAGRGGFGDQLNGRSGNVLNVTAAAISSIVAGRPTAAAPADFAMVNLVDRVSLRGLAVPTVQPDGSFDLISAPGANPPRVGFLEANLVGAIAGNPGDPGANVFKIDQAGVPTNVPASALAMRAVAGGTFEYNHELNPANPPDWRLFRPVDGFVAAQQIGVNSKNFRPEALMTLVNPRDAASIVFLDYRNDFNRNS